MLQYSGLIAWYLLIAETILGTMLSGAVAKITAPYRRKLLLHSILSWTLLLAVALHIALVVTTHWHGWGVADVTTLSLVGPLARNFGVLAGWLTLVVVVTASLRKVVNQLWWRRLHRTLPFVLLIMGTAHGLLAGTHGTTLPVILPAMVALTFLFSVVIVRANVIYTRKLKRRPFPRYKHVRSKKIPIKE